MAYTRQQLKQDKFAETAKETVSWAVEHQSKIVTTIVVFIVALLAVVGGWFYFNQRNEAASAEIGKALRTYETPLRPANAPAMPNSPSFVSAKERAEAARKQFQEVQQRYPYTAAGEMARYFVGVTSFDMGDNAQAEKVLKEVAGSRNQGLSALAKFALGSVYRAENKDADAIKVYEDLVAHPAPTVPKSTAQLELASLYQDKQPQEATRIYEQIQKDQPNSAASQIAATRMASLKKQ